MRALAAGPDCPGERSVDRAASSLRAGRAASPRLEDEDARECEFHGEYDPENALEVDVRRLEKGRRGASRGEYSPALLLAAGRTRVARSTGGASSALFACCWLALRGAPGRGSVVSSERDRAGGVGVWDAGEEPGSPQGAVADASVDPAVAVRLSLDLFQRARFSKNSARRRAKRDSKASTLLLVWVSGSGPRRECTHARCPRVTLSPSSAAMASSGSVQQSVTCCLGRIRRRDSARYLELFFASAPRSRRAKRREREACERREVERRRPALQREPRLRCVRGPTLAQGDDRRRACDLHPLAAQYGVKRFRFSFDAMRWQNSSLCHRESTRGESPPHSRSNEEPCALAIS